MIMKQKKIFALGFFDGVHKGHQMVLDLCQHLADDAGVATAAITFEKHPQSLFTPNPPALINTTEDRRWLLQTWAGMDYLLVFQVTEQIMTMPWQNFLELLLREGAVGFVCGYDFRFGKNGEGNAERLAKFSEERGLPWYIVDEQTMDGEKISSTRIRTLIEAGDMEGATALLGHFHMLTGTVVAGQKLGRTIGIPTANLELPDELVKPAFGVYACKAHVDGNWYNAVTNVGTRPTVNGQNVTVEPWILDFDGDLYGKEITLFFHKFLRPEQKFGSLEALKSQIQKDAADTYKLLR
jgi:riboflavin kinase/FMN adenylyltransferase